MNYLMIFSLFFFIACNPDDENKQFLSLINNSNEDLYFYNSENFLQGHFPDTLLPFNRPSNLQPVIANGGSSKYGNVKWSEIYS